MKIDVGKGPAAQVSFRKKHDALVLWRAFALDWCCFIIDSWKFGIVLGPDRRGMEKTLQVGKKGTGKGRLRERRIGGKRRAVFGSVRGLGARTGEGRFSDLCAFSRKAPWRCPKSRGKMRWDNGYNCSRQNQKLMFTSIWLQKKWRLSMIQARVFWSTLPSQNKWAYLSFIRTIFQLQVHRARTSTSSEDSTSEQTSHSLSASWTRWRAECPSSCPRCEIQAWKWHPFHGKNSANGPRESSAFSPLIRTTEQWGNDLLFFMFFFTFFFFLLLSFPPHESVSIELNGIDHEAALIGQMSPSPKVHINIFFFFFFLFWFVLFTWPD